MSERFNEVRVLSARTDRRGTSRINQIGEGTILNDDPNTVHISGDGWYGEWPVDETNVPELRDQATENKPHLKIEDEDYRYLIEKLMEQGLEWAPKGETTVLVKKDGSYLRLPTKEEAEMNFNELDQEGLVSTHDQ